MLKFNNIGIKTVKMFLECVNRIIGKVKFFSFLEVAKQLSFVIS
ncbi:hypothetical protein [Clostridium estertheticum]|nr:hypothetical protein [Clostridium estertheticum]